MIKKLFVLLLIISIVLIIPVSAENLKKASDISLSDINQAVINEKMSKASYDKDGTLLRGEHGETNSDTLKQLLLDKTISNTEYDRMIILIYDEEDIISEKVVQEKETIPEETIPEEEIILKKAPQKEITISEETIINTLSELPTTEDNNVVVEKSFIDNIILFLQGLIG